MQMRHFSRLLCCSFFFLALWPIFCQAQPNGYSIAHFNSENGLPNTIKGLHYDRNGFIWLATESGLIRFDGMRFETYDRSETGKPVSRLFNVASTTDGDVCIQTENAGCFYVTPNNTLRAIDKETLLKKGVSQPLIVSAAALHKACDQKQRTGTLPDRAMPATGGSGHSYMNSITCAEGFFYYLNKHNEIWVTDTAFHDFRRVKLIGKTSRLTPQPTLVSLAQQGTNIYLRSGDTLYQLNFGINKSVASLTPLLSVGKITNIVSVLNIPDKGLAIIGTISDGIYIFRKQRFTSVVTPNDAGNIFYAGVPFKHNGVLTPKGVLYPGHFIPFNSHFFANAVFQTKEGNYLLNRRSKDSAGICELNGQLQKVRDIAFQKPVYCFRQTKEGTILFSADSNFLARINGDSVQWLPVPPSLPRPFRIASFIQSRDGRWWLGGKQGLVKADLSKNSVAIIGELKNIFVRALYEDARGTLWIGTYGNGFYALYHNKLIAFPSDKNHYLNYVHCFMPDHSNRLWLTTNHGLFLYNCDDLYAYLETKNNAPYYYYFDHTAGLLTNEFNGGGNPAGIVTGNGQFSFPSLKGLIQFFPDSLQLTFPTAAIFVDKIVADTTRLFLTEKKLMLPSETRSVRLYISSPYYGNYYNQRIEYSIDNSNQWYLLNEDYMLEMDNAGKGDHTVQFRKQGGFGADKLITKEITFTVRPFFYETVTFRLLLSALLITLLYFLYRLRVRLLLQQRTRLKEQVAEKTKEQDLLIEDLETVVAELEQSKEDLQRNIAFKETLSMIITHDLQSPLRFLSNAFEQIDVEYAYADAETRQLSQEMKRTSSNIYQFVKDFGIWIRKVNMLGGTEITEVNLSRLILQTAAFFGELRQAHNNEIHTHLQPGVLIDTDYQMLKIILHNIIDNANKYSRNGTIHISLTTQNGAAIVKIQDTGIGMKPAVLLDLMNRVQPESLGSNGSQSTGTGLGYRFITDFCRILDISLHLESKINEGTIVTLSNLKLCQQMS